MAQTTIKGQDVERALRPGLRHSQSIVLRRKQSFWCDTLVAGAWTERKKMYHGGSFLKLADDNMDIQNPEAQNRELSGF